MAWKKVFVWMACVGGVACSAAEVTEPAPVEIKAKRVRGGNPIVDINPDPAIVEINLTAREALVALEDGSITRMYAFNGTVPGPLIEANVGDELIVHFTNELPEPTTIHWHGMRVPNAMDGTPRVQTPVAPGESFEYRFVIPDAGTYWYHPHVRTHEQVERGLYGPLVVHDPVYDPEYDAERVIVLDDIRVDDDAQIAAFNPARDGMHGRSGNYLLSNGRRYDLARATAALGSLERWRLINSANARRMILGLTHGTMKVIATDGGLLHTPVEVERLSLAPGERYDIEIRLNQPEHELISYVFALDEDNEVVELPFSMLHIDTQARKSGERAAKGVFDWPELPPLPEREVTRVETIQFDGINDPDKGLRWRLNGRDDWDEPMFTFSKGDTVKILLRNRGGPEHPFHLHGQFFRVLDPAIPGLKDTVLVPGMSTVEIEAYFDNVGHWMAHCHILEHAALGMMASVEVVQ